MGKLRQILNGLHKYHLILYAGGSYLTITLFSAIFSLLCTHLMSATLFGELRYVMAWLPILMVASLPGYDVVALREVSRGQHLLIGRVLLVRLGGGVVGSILLALALWFQVLKVGATSYFFFSCLVILLPFYETATSYKNYLLAVRLKKQGLWLVARNRLFALFILLLGSGIIYWVPVDPKWLLPSYLVAIILPTLFSGITIALRQLRSTRLRRGSRQTPRMAVVVVTSLAGLFNVLAFSLDKLMVHYYLGAAVLAYYSILVMLPLEAVRLIESIYPVYYRALFLQTRGVVWRRLLWWGGLVVLGLLGYIIGFTTLSPWVFGEFYQYNLLLVSLAALLILSGALENYVWQKIFAWYGSRLCAIYSISSVLVSWVSYRLVCQAHWGLTGILVALLVRQSLQPLLFLQLLRKKWGLA